MQRFEKGVKFIGGVKAKYMVSNMDSFGYKWAVTNNKKSLKWILKLVVHKKYIHHDKISSKVNRIVSVFNSDDIVHKLFNDSSSIIFFG